MVFLQDEAAAKAFADSLQAKAAAFGESLEGKTANEVIETLAQAALHFGLKLLAALLIFAVGAWVIKMVRKGVRSRMSHRRSQDSALISFIDSLIAITLWILLIVMVVGALGINTASIAALLAAGGMAIGMAMSGTVQNFAGGLILLAFKPFKSGDYIGAQGYEGRVVAMNIVSTKLMTRDNKMIIIPNGSLSNDKIINFSALELRRVDWKVDVSYGSDSAAVIAELTNIMKADVRILDSSTEGAADPCVVLSALKDSSVEFTAFGWISNENYLAVLFDINNAIYTTLPRKGIQFPFPQMDVHLKQQ